MRLTVAVFVFLALTLGAFAEPTTWTLSGLTLNDGVTASGSFTFDPDAGTACSTASSPCGTYSSVDITTTAGGGLSAETYSFVCHQNVAGCTGLSPDSTEVLFLTSNSADQTGLPGLAFFFARGGALPPAGLTDAGGTIDVSNSSLSVGAVEEAICSDAACTGPSSPFVASIAGSVVATPEPSYTLLLGVCLAGLGLAGFYRRRAFGRNQGQRLGSS
jgi:hypothetical protein